MPQDESSFLCRPLQILTQGVVRLPWLVVVLGVVTGIACIQIARQRLEYKTSRLDLLNPHDASNQLWIEYIEEFGAEDDAVVVVEGDDRDAVVAALQELSEAIEQRRQLFRAVLHEVDLSVIRSKGLHYLPPEELARIDAFVSQVEPILRGDWSPLNLRQMALGLNARLRATTDGPRNAASAATFSSLSKLAHGVRASLSEEGGYQSPWPDMPEAFAALSELGSRYLLSNEGRVGFILLRLADSAENSFTRGTESIRELRQVLTVVDQRHPEVAIGLTGLPVMEHDEMALSQTEMTEATVIGFVGVFCLFVAGFGGVRHSALALGTLLLGMIWSLGFVTQVVGHLNILSSAFAVVLIGLGINYPIHYVARYLELRRQCANTREALVKTSTSIGPGIVTGAVTTSIAFFAAGFTEFSGVAELGIIAGGGVLLCVFAAMAVLPAVIQLWDSQRPLRILPEFLRVDQWILPLFRFPRGVLAATLAFTVVAGGGLTALWYDHNLLHLQAVGIESVELEKKLLDEYGQSVWFALSIADSREELLERKAQFLQLDSVSGTEEIVSLLPLKHEQNRPLIEQIRQKLEDLPERPTLIAVDPPESLGKAFAEAQDTVSRMDQGGASGLALLQVRDALRRLPEAECYRRISYYQQQMAGDLLSRLHLLSAFADPEPPQLSDLPEELVTRFVGHKHGRHLLKIYARDNTWDMEALKKFVEDVRGVDPRATGNPLQTYEASRTMQRSYQMAAWYALAGIAVAIWLDFRSVGHTLLALLPLLLSMLQTFGLLGLLDIPLNPANMIALPLLIGLGVEDGVHIVHDFRSQPGRYRVSPSIAIAVVLTSVTTVASFASLMTASHQGLYSLGRVMTIGVVCCLITSLLLLPAILTVWTRHRPSGTSSVKPAWVPKPHFAGEEPPAANSAEWSEGGPQPPRQRISTRHPRGGVWRA